MNSTHQEQLRTKLAAAADGQELLDVAYSMIDSPIGPLLLAATRNGLVYIAFENEGFDDVLQILANRISPRILRAPARLDTAARQLDEFFDGRRTSFELPLDLSLSSPFRRNVQEILAEVPFGVTTTYAHLAQEVGSPGASRAVGSACATNPIPVIIPCHRVLRTDGKLGGYRGGLDSKRFLLELESAPR